MDRVWKQNHVLALDHCAFFEFFNGNKKKKKKKKKEMYYRSHIISCSTLGQSHYMLNQHTSPLAYRAS